LDNAKDSIKYREVLLDIAFAKFSVAFVCPSDGAGKVVSAIFTKIRDRIICDKSGVLGV